MLARDAENLLSYILAADRHGAVDYVDTWAIEHGYTNAINVLLEPAMREFGIQWSQDENISLAQGYIAGKIAEDVVNRAFAEYNPTAPVHNSRCVVIGNVEDDYHQLGRRLLGSFLTMHGWHVIDLGNDVLADDFIDAALENKARIIGVSAMMYDNALNIIRIREGLTRRNLNGHIQLAVGGAIFNEHTALVKQVGGDGTAENAIKALNLFDDLWELSLAMET
jgi:methanogenic corrinoid protein MtbC1